MPKRSLARDVAVALAVKLAVVAAAGMLLFGPRERPNIDAGMTATRLIGSSEVDRQPRISLP